jgi:ribosomal protein L7/L12
MNPQNFTIREQGKVQEIYNSEGKIHAVKYVKNTSGCSLQEAKNAVEDLMDNDWEEDEQVRPSSQMRTIDDDWEISSDR